MAVNAMTISEAVNAAVEKHPSIEVAKQEILVNEQKIKIAKSAFYPKVDLKVNYGNEDKKSKANTATSYTKENIDGGYHVEVVATQNIFNGYADSANVDKNQALHQSSEFKRISSIDKLSYDVIRTYLEILRLREVLKYEENSIKKFEDYYSLATKKSNVTGQKSETYTVKGTSVQRYKSGHTT
ncbi:TolC family protein [Poseidonibacter ostreae]|nr:TolC family protein [Poseidonibacter ostreae]